MTRNAQWFIDNKFIEVTHLDLVAMVQNAYALSHPKGMGWLHYSNEPMTKEQAEYILGQFATDRRYVVDLDCIGGRALKFRIMRSSEGGRYFTDHEWYDHSKSDLERLLKDSAK